MAESKSTGNRRDRVQRVRDANGKLTGYLVQIRRTGYPVVTKRFKRLEDARAWRERVAREVEQRQIDPAALGSRYRVSDAIDAYLAGEFRSRQAFHPPGSAHSL
ncbi:MAG: hypothetical protein R3F24_05160 [Gammaproteobacteria bacterium]